MSVCRSNSTQFSGVDSRQTIRWVWEGTRPRQEEGGHTLPNTSWRTFHDSWRCPEEKAPQHGAGDHGVWSHLSQRSYRGRQMGTRSFTKMFCLFIQLHNSSQITQTMLCFIKTFCQTISQIEISCGNMDRKENSGLLIRSFLNSASGLQPHWENSCSLILFFQAPDWPTWP